MSKARDLIRRLWRLLDSDRAALTGIILMLAAAAIAAIFCITIATIKINTL